MRGAGKGKAGTDSSLTIWTCDKDSNEDSPQFIKYEEYASCPGCRNSGRLLYGPENTIDNKVYCVAVESRDKGSRFKLESCKDKGGQIFQRQDIIFDGRELRLTSLNLCMNFDKFEKDQEVFSASCSQSLSMGGWRMIGCACFVLFCSYMTVGFRFFNTLPSATPIWAPKAARQAQLTFI